MKTKPGEIIDSKYEVVGTLGSGGFGTVFRARQLDFDREVAVKVLDSAGSDERVKRFEREATILQSFQTKFIPAIYGFGLWNGRPYMAMELVQGTSLASVLAAEHALELDRVVPLVRDLAKALDYAHARGVIHRDLSPNNILLVQSDGREQARIIDFGLATFSQIDLRNRQKLTEAGFAIGSFQYMSPEQCLAEPVDARSDIYSLGCIIYRMLTGRVPYEADNEMLLMRKHVNEATPHVPSQFPPNVQTIIDRSMAKDREKRYQTMSELLDDWKIVGSPRDPKTTKGLPSSLTFLALSLAIVSVTAIVALSPRTQKVQELPPPRGTATHALEEAIEEQFQLSNFDPNYDTRVVQIGAKLEGALRANELNHDFSARELEEAYDYLGRMYRKQKRYAEARAVCQKGINLQLARNTATPLIIRNFANCSDALGVGPRREAISVLRGIIAHQPPLNLQSTGEARMSLGELLVAEGRYDEALEIIPDYTKLGPLELHADRWRLCFEKAKASIDKARSK